MNIINYFQSHLPISNYPDLLNLHHGNPLGISPLIQVLFIFVVVEALAVVDYFIRNRGKMQYYPYLFGLFALAMISIYYYCFQSGLPTIKNTNFMVDEPCIGWFCQHKIVGWGWTVVGLVALIHVIYTLLCAVMQVMAGMSERAKMLEGKRWKEWKTALTFFLIGVTVSGIAIYANFKFTPWILLALAVAYLVFAIVKAVADIRRFHNHLWPVLMGVVFFLGILAVTMLTLECLRASIFLLVVLLVFFSRAKASKKNPKKKVAAKK